MIIIASIITIINKDPKRDLILDNHPDMALLYAQLEEASMESTSF